MATFRLIVPPFNNYLSPVTNLFLSPPDIIPSMYYTNCFLFPKSLVITYVCAVMGLLYPTCNLVICEKNFLNLMLYSDIY